MKRLFVLNKPSSPAAEAYRSIRANIKALDLDGRRRTLMVCSSTPGEGRTTTLCNLAVTLSKAGHKVLVVDLDLRKPDLHRMFSLENVQGVSEALARENLEPKTIHHFVLKNLSVLTAGQALENPGDLICSAYLKTLLNELSEAYDYVLLDTPPILTAADAIQLSHLTDGVIMVFSARGVSMERGKKALAELESVKAHVIGAIVNRAGNLPKMYLDQRKRT